MTASTRMKALAAAFALVIGGTGIAQANSFAHSAQASEHSVAASGHGSAAVATGAATVVAVPVIAVGSGLYLSGEALTNMGESTAGAGSQILLDANRPLQPIQLGPVADPAPALD